MPTSKSEEFFECVWPFCGVGALRVKLLTHFMSLVCFYNYCQYYQTSGFLLRENKKTLVAWNALSKSLLCLTSGYSKMDQIKFVEDSLQKIWSAVDCTDQDCLSQTLLGPFLNTLTHILHCGDINKTKFGSWLWKWYW